MKQGQMDTPISYDPGLLGRLRARLSAQGLNGFLAPHADAHRSEYLPPADERLARLTGFTGSAGFAVVLEDAAALFVDGRYTLQAANQVDGKAFEIVPIAKTSPAAWLRDRIRAGWNVAYDPWLHTPRELEAFAKAASDAGAALSPLDENVLDAEWPDRPGPPNTPVEPLGPPYAPLTSKAKRGQLGEELAKRGAHAAVLSAGDSIAWAFNIRARDVPYTPLVLAFAILTREAKAQLFIDPARLDDDARAHLGADVEILPSDALGAELDALGAARRAVAVDPAGTAQWIVNRLDAAGARLIEGDDPCLLPKACKTPGELEGVKRAHVRDGCALAMFLAWLEEAAPRGGVSERDAVARLDALRAGNDLFRGLSFPTISGSGPNGAIVHYQVTAQSDRALKTGELYLVDSGAQYLDGTTDVTRTVAIGAPTAEMKDRFTRVLKGHIAIATQRFPKGTQGQELDVLARRALWEAGLDYEHGTGHGVGTYLGVHEGPQRIAKRGPGAELRVGMVLSNEPGYYKAGAYGIRIENLVAVTPAPTPKGGEREMLAFESLTLAPIDLNLVEPGLLAREEAAWLDAYHARVRETLSPLVDDKTRAWLARATRPIGISP